jgi:wyosine [tRNA(Phe)-imidazoG37] synthetase (radical SAM superfamily)
MKYIYGPVRSRRLGLSLGVSLIPYKTCTFDCVYCQLGQTTLKTTERKEYVSTAEILAELKSWLDHNRQQAQQLQYITFAGYGEPTLNPKIGQLIEEIKKLTPAPVAVITNSSLLTDPSVRRQLLGADLIVPSLDAATPELFEKIDRPHADIRLDKIVDSLIDLRGEFKGKIWLEVMLIKGLNDSLAHIHQLKEAADRINPDKIQLNSPVRAKPDSCVTAVDKDKLAEFKKILGDKCEAV